MLLGQEVLGGKLELWQRSKVQPFPGLMGGLYVFISREVEGKDVECCLVQTEKGQQVQLL